MANKIEKLLEVNVVYWTQASRLLQQGYEPEFIRTTSVDEQPKFHVVFKEKRQKSHKVVLDRKGDTPEVALIDDASIYNLIATHTNDRSFSLPLASPNNLKTHKAKATICIKKPSPRIFWTLMVDDKPVMGERSNVVSFEKMSDALARAYQMGAGAAEVEIQVAASKYFKARETRNQLVNKTLEAQGMNLRTWALDQGLSYSALYRVLNRGDEIADLKTKLANVVGLDEEALWPAIDWN